MDRRPWGLASAPIAVLAIGINLWLAHHESAAYVVWFGGVVWLGLLVFDWARHEPSQTRNPGSGALVNLIFTIVVLAAVGFVLYQGIHDDWSFGPVIPITLGAKGFQILLDLPPELWSLASMAMFTVVLGSIILVANWAAKKELSWWIAGCTLFSYGAGMATVIRRARMSLRR